jgi:hypothetical protein
MGMGFSEIKERGTDLFTFLVREKWFVGDIDSCGLLGSC